MECMLEAKAASYRGSLGLPGEGPANRQYAFHGLDAGNRSSASVHKAIHPADELWQLLRQERLAWGANIE